MKNITKLLFACILALTSTLIHAQDMSNMSNWTPMEWQRYNEKMQKVMKDAGREASTMDTFQPFLNPCTLLIRCGASALK